MDHDQGTVKEIKKMHGGFKGALTAPLMIDVPDKDIDAIRKDWFKHVLINIEKLYCIVEETKKNNIASLQILRDDIKELTYKIKTHSEGKNTASVMKTVVCGALAGFVGGIVAIAGIYIIEAILFK